MIVDHAGGLHERVADGRADEGKTSRAQVAAHGVRFGGVARQVFERFPRVARWFSVDELPDIRIEAAM